MTGLPATVPAVDILIAGFVSLQIIARYNVYTSRRLFEGLRRYVQAVRPKIVICENVGGLLKRTQGESPQIVNVGEAFKRLGCHFAYRHVDARRYLLPHRRARV